MDWSQIKTFIDSFGPVQWGIVAAIIGLFFGADKKVLPLAKAAWSKLQSLRKPADGTPPEDTRSLLDILAELEARREALVDEVRRIDKLLGVKDGFLRTLDEVADTEVDRSE